MISEQEILDTGILIVDDQQSDIFLHGEMLRDAGYTSIESTTDPAEVWTLYHKNHQFWRRIWPPDGHSPISLTAGPITAVRSNI